VINHPLPWSKQDIVVISIWPNVNKHFNTSDVINLYMYMWLYRLLNQYHKEWGSTDNINMAIPVKLAFIFSSYHFALLDTFGKLYVCLFICLFVYVLFICVRGVLSNLTPFVLWEFIFTWVPSDHTSTMQ